MTLDFKKLVRNSVLKQMKIQHFECECQIFKKEELPANVLQKIQSAYGADFLEDANYTLWFSGQNITKEIVEKTIFKISNKSLGEAANNMTENDLKMIELGSGSGNASVERPVETSDEVDSITDRTSDETNDRVIGDMMNSDDEDADEAGDLEDDRESLDESVEAPVPGEKFVFLKITMK